MTRDTIFMDGFGVLHDARLVTDQWGRLSAEYLVPRLGGDPARWAAANDVAFQRLGARYVGEPPATRGPVRAYLRRDALLWLRDMCALAGVSAPADDEEATRLAEETGRFVTPRVTPTIDGAVDAARALHAMGYALHTASNAPSYDLDGYLRGLGVRALFGKCFGPDLVETWKSGSEREFYRAILDDTGTTAERAIVVDDHERHLDAAASLGCEVVLVRDVPRASEHTVVRSLADLATRLAASSSGRLRRE